MKVTQDLSPKAKLTKSQESQEIDNKINKKSLKIDSEGRGDKSYSVSMSKQALARKEFSDSILNELKKTPEVRQDKVDSIKEKIANGTYQIDSEAIVNNFLKEEALDSMAFGLLTRKKS